MLGVGLLGGAGVAFAALGTFREAAREPVAVTRPVEATSPSYESVLATLGPEARVGRGLSGPALAAPLSGLGGCGRPLGMRANLRVAVWHGHAEGVSVYTTPRDPAVAQCIDREIRSLAWPDAPGLSTLVRTL
jgi:hypothetical protein